jgi:hypothetical protein
MGHVGFGMLDTLNNLHEYIYLNLQMLPLGRVVMHLPVLLKFSQQITKSYVVHSMLMELCLLLAALTLLQGCGMLARVLQRNMTNQIMRWIYYLGMKMMLTMCSLVDVLWLPDLFRLILVTQLRKKVALSSEIPGSHIILLPAPEMAVQLYGFHDLEGHMEKLGAGHVLTILKFPHLQ